MKPPPPNPPASCWRASLPSSLGILSGPAPLFPPCPSGNSGMRDSVYLFFPIGYRKQSNGREAEYSDKHGQYLIGHGG